MALPTIELLVTLTAVFLLLAVLASKVSSRIGIPGLLLFLAIGMLAGSDGLGGIPFDNAWLAQGAGVLALVLILFSGGLDTKTSDIKPVFWRGLGLATLGVLITALAMGLFAVYVLGFSLYEGILLGAIISSTDAAAVLTLLRGRGLNLRAGLKPLLEMESGSNDPMAVFLTLGMIVLIVQPSTTPFTLVPMFLLQMAVGGVVGYAIGRLSVGVINRLRLEYDGLYAVATLTACLLAYGLAALLQGNGFLAVYLAGLLLGNSDFIHRRSLSRFHDGLAWIMQIVMFVTLGLLVFPSQLVAVIPEGLVTSLFLIFVARPLAVFLVLAPTRMHWRKLLFISWVGLRGAAPIVLATFPLLAGIEQANTIFNLVFFIVITSVLLQGTLLAPVAKWLKLSSPIPPKSQSPLAEILEDGHLVNDLLEVTLPDSCAVIGKQVIELGLPAGALIAVIGRQGDVVIPNGSTVLEPNDVLLLVTTRDTRELVRQMLIEPENPFEV